MRSIAVSLAILFAVFGSLGTPRVRAESLPKRPHPALQPVVEAVEDVYRFQPADNGAGPMWCSGSTCLVRIGDDLFASGLETLPGVKPLNNCRWTLWKRTPQGWELQQADRTGRTREPCPMAAFPGGPLWMSVNPTLVTDPNAHAGPARPELLEFSPGDAKGPFRTILPEWKGTPAFSEHSYRSFAADGPNRELILFQNIGYTHAEWAFRDRRGRWAAQGKLVWPWGAEYDTPQPIRVCYPNVMLKDRALYFCGVSDVVEPYARWRKYKKELTGRNWDFDFRRLFFTWTPDVTTGKFEPWVEIASRDKTCGWIMPGDLWAAPDGAVHLLWMERAIDERLREKFFPGEKQSHALRYAVVRGGKVALRRTLVEAGEGLGSVVPAAGRFQVTPDGELVVFYYASGTDASGRAVSENRAVAIGPGGVPGPHVRVPMDPFNAYFTATVRAGSPPSRWIELLGHRVGRPTTINYARVRLWSPRY